MDMQRAVTLTQVSGSSLVREVEVCVTVCTTQWVDTVNSARLDFTDILEDC